MASYVLATTHNKVKWYKFDLSPHLKPGAFELLDVLDLQEIPCFSDKQTAKRAAQALGLKTYRYVKLS